MVCAGLEPDQLDRLSEIATEVAFARNQVVFLERDAGTHLFTVTSGVVRVLKTLPDGRRQITGFLFEGDILGLMLDGGYVYSAETSTVATLCRIPRKKIESLMAEVPRLLARMLALTTHELAAAQEQMLVLGRKSAKERVASFLLSLARRSERRGGPGGRLDMPMTRAEIADYLGLTMETVSRILSEFRRGGVIGLDPPQTVSLLRRDILLKLAQGDVPVGV